MEQFLVYIGKAALAAGSFYLAYLALFQHQKHFLFNRIYLPVSFLVSFLIPLITFTSIRYIQPIETTVANSFAYLPETTNTTEPRFVFQWYHYLIGVYSAGTICFATFLIVGHLKAIKIIRYSRLKELFGAEVNVTKHDVHPFSFFSRIVLSEKTLNNPSLKMIVNHEMVHVKERHTLDILFAEILFLFQWFNPFAWLIRDAMRNNLEYLTDHQITQSHNAEQYQLAMVGLAHKKGVAPFLTALNGSQLKNRIIMMKKKTENRYNLLKQLVVLPLLAILVMGLSNKEVKTEIAQTNDLLSSANPIENTGKGLASMKIVVDGKIIPTDHPNLKGMDFSKDFDSGKICDALELKDIEVNSMVIDEKQPTLYIRTSAYIDGTNKEFENHTSTQASSSSPAKTNNYYAINGKIVTQTEFEKQGEQGFDNVIFLTGNDATKKYGNEFNGTIADATTGSSNFKIKNTVTVKGKVTNEKGEPIAATTVVIKGITTGTITNNSGDYEIKTEKNSTLIFSMLDYEKKEVEVNKQKEINVILKAKTTAKNNEIEIVPIGDEKKADIIEIKPAKIDISGNTKNPPLYFVDGKETKNIEEIKPEDIEKMTVLKGESATALYGEEGKYGAILVTTKSDKITTRLELRKSIAKIIKYPKKATSSGFVTCMIITDIDKDGNVNIVSKKPSENFIKMEEVVVTAYKDKTEEVLPPKEVMSLCREECERVINKLPKIAIPELIGKEVGFVVKFQLQDKQ